MNICFTLIQDTYLDSLVFSGLFVFSEPAIPVAPRCILLGVLDRREPALLAAAIRVSWFLVGDR